MSNKTTDLSYVLLENIKPNPLNSYATEPDDIQEKKNSIQAYGLIEPLVVLRNPDDTYVLIAGETRLKAITELNNEGKIDFKSIPCHVLGNAGEYTDIEQELLIETSNLETRLSIERGKHQARVMNLLKELVKKGELPERKVSSKAAELFKTSKRWGRLWAQVFVGEDADEELQDMVAEGDITIKQAANIMTFEPETKQEVKEKIRSGENPSVAIEEKRQEARQPQPPVSAYTSAAPSPSPVPAPSPVIVPAEPEKVPTKEEISSAIDTMNMMNEPEHAEAIDFDGEEADLDENGFQKSFDVGSLLSDDDYSFAQSDTTGLLQGLSRSSKKDAEYAEELRKILAWCEKIKKVEDPSPEEWDVINACGEVADRFL